MNKKFIFIVFFLFFICLNTVVASNDTNIGKNIQSDSIFENSKSITYQLDADGFENVILNTSDKLIIYGDGGYFTGDLHYKNGTPMVNKEITFTVNSINYTKLTNSSGIAQLKINLNPGIYPISTSYGDIVNENIIFVRNSNVTFINEGATNSEIQSIIDNAENGDTIEFLGKNYNDISLSISKNINLVSYRSTILNGLNNKPIISISGRDASNSKFSGLNLKGGSIGIEIINSANNVEIINNTISNCIDGISLYDVMETKIDNNSIININNNAINLKESSKINISNNYIKTNQNGIYYDSGNRNINIINNTFEQSKNYAINLDKSGEYSNIENNNITNNENGVNIDCNANELYIKYNSIASNKENGVYFGQNYRKTNSEGNPIISDNSIMYNGHMNMLAKDSIYDDINIGGNWFGSDNKAYAFVCNKIKPIFYGLSTNQVGPGTFEISVGLNGNTNPLIPSFVLSVSFDGGRTYQAVTVSNGKATIHVSNGDGSVLIRSEGPNINFQLSNYSPYVPDSNNPDRDNQNSSKPTTPNQNVNSNGTTNTNQGEGGSSQSSTMGSINGNSNLNVGISSASSSSSAADSSGSASEVIQESDSTTSSDSSGSASEVIQESDSTTSSSKNSVSKSLTIDDEIVRISGIGLIIILIILVIGFYYRKDIKDMIVKMKE